MFNLSSYKLVKLGAWGPFSVFSQIIFSYLIYHLTELSEFTSFALAIIITININYFVASKYIFLKNISLKKYTYFLMTSGLTRYIDLIFYELISYGFSYEIKIIVCSGIGVVIRYVLYEYIVFNKISDFTN